MERIPNHNKTIILHLFNTISCVLLQRWQSPKSNSLWFYQNCSKSYLNYQTDKIINKITTYCFKLNSNELLWMVFVSALLTIFIEFPFSNIKQIIFKKRRKSNDNSSIKLDLNANIKFKDNHIKNMLD